MSPPPDAAVHEQEVPDGEDAPLGTLFARAADDAKAFARAQVELWRHTALYRFASIKWALVCALTAVFLLGSTLTALLVGLILSLAPLVGPLGATAIVVLATLIVAGLLISFAIGRFRALGDPIPGERR